MNSSQFDNNKIISQLLENATVVSNIGATCDTFMAKMHGKRILIKRLKDEHRFNPRYRLALQKEFEAGFILEHSAIPRYLNIYEDSIIMDFIDGITLKEFLKENPTYFNKKRNINRFLNQLLDCLGYLHSHSIIHLDLKPENIMMTRVGNDVKVIDLGFCYTDSYHNTIGYNNTFAAPEQLCNDCDIDIRTDIFSVGKILSYILNDNPLNSKYNSIIKKATQKNKTKRFQTAEEFAYAINSSKSKYKIISLISIIVATSIIFALYSNFNTNYNPTKPSSVTYKTESIPMDTNKHKNNEPAVIQAIPSKKSDNNTPIKNKLKQPTTDIENNIDYYKINIKDFEYYIKKNALEAYIPLYDFYKDTAHYSNGHFVGEAIVKCESNIHKITYEFLKNKPEEYKRKAYDSLRFYMDKYGYIPTIKKLQNEGLCLDIKLNY